MNDLKEQFSFAYVRAVAHAAGYFVDDVSRMQDADGVDLTVFKSTEAGPVRSPKLHLQVKATAAELSGDPFPFDLPVKNYDELRSVEYQVPRLLVVVAVPSDVDRWVSASESELVLRHCGYWTSLRGQPRTDNSTTVRVRIPRTARFHVEPVRAMMERIHQGGLP